MTDTLPLDRESNDSVVARIGLKDDAIDFKDSVGDILVFLDDCGELNSEFFGVDTSSRLGQELDIEFVSSPSVSPNCPILKDS